jgi:hypothetical protein
VHARCSVSETESALLLLLAPQDFWELLESWKLLR